MTDLHDMRSRLRDTRGHQAAAGGGFKIPFALLAGVAVVAGFLLVLFMPKIYSVQRTSALPVFKEARVRVEEPVPAPVVAAPPIATVKADYAGKGADEAGRIADAVCAQRATAAPQQGQAAVEAKLHCFLSEGTARFCSGSQARKATADIINYFKGIEYANAGLGVAAKMPLRAPPNDAAAQAPTMLTPDARVVEAAEGLMQAGYLHKGYREDIAANVPRVYKERFTRIVGIKSPCPAPPWWAAMWK
jgi:hypothetical protein